MRKYFDSVINATTGLPIAGANIAVTTPLGGAVQLYSDDGVTPIASPAVNQVVTDSNGLFQFFVSSGTYRLTVTSGSAIIAIDDVEIFDDAILGPLTILSKAANYTVTTNDLGKMIAATAQTGSLVISLPASPADGSQISIAKTDTNNATRVTVRNAAAVDLCWLSTPKDSVVLIALAGSWVAVSWNISPLTNVFSASGTWTKPPLGQRLDLLLIGGGGGGGGGRRGAAGSNRAGGGGGAGGYVVTHSVPAERFGATSPVVVGTGGAGGAGGASNDTSGGNGSTGGTSTFTSSASGRGYRALGGASGTGGSAAIGVGGGVGPYATTYQPSGGGSSSLTATANLGSDGTGPAGGGGGGSLDSANVQRLPAAGGTGTSQSTAFLSGGAAGSAGVAGGAGTAIGSGSEQIGGGGGGGGYAGSGVAATNGGAGGNIGGGGGGGGASDNGQASGTGGAGANGIVYITTFFD